MGSIELPLSHIDWNILQRNRYLYAAHPKSQPTYFLLQLCFTQSKRIRFLVVVHARFVCDPPKKSAKNDGSILTPKLYVAHRVVAVLAVSHKKKGCESSGGGGDALLLGEPPINWLKLQNICGRLRTTDDGVSRIPKTHAHTHTYTHKYTHSYRHSIRSRSRSCLRCDWDRYWDLWALAIR